MGAKGHQALPFRLRACSSSSTGSLQVIWNNSMRQELLELLEQQRAAAASAAGAATAGEGGGAALAPPAVAAAEGFTYRCLQGELVLAGVFVRVYTEQPDFQLSGEHSKELHAPPVHVGAQSQLCFLALAPLPLAVCLYWLALALKWCTEVHQPPCFCPADPAAFCKALVTYIYQQQQVVAGAAEKPRPADGRSEQQRQQAHLLQALRALRLVLEGAPRLLGLLSTKPAVDPLLECLRPACTAGLAVQTPEGPWAPPPPGGGSEMAAALAASPPPWAASSAAALPGASAAELEGAELALTVLLRLTAHAGGWAGRS